MLIRAFLVSLVLLATPWSVSAAPLSAPITVTERAGTPRKAEVVSLGVPLPKAERPSTKDRFFAPSTRSKIWWSLWPAAAPKELGLLSRAGQFYLHTIWSSSPR
jgi:hypothetical protein